MIKKSQSYLIGHSSDLGKMCVIMFEIKIEMLLSSRYLRTRQVYTLHRCSLSDPHCNTLLLFLLVLCEIFPGRVFSSPS